MRWIDLPPFWLLLCVVLTWASPWVVPWGSTFFGGLLFFAARTLLTLAALLEFRRSATTVVPRKAPSALITGGIFRWSRNPIYLADIFILLAFALIWGKLLGFFLAPVLGVFLDRRFIRGEEARLRVAFGDAFDRYAETTRRWI